MLEDLHRQEGKSNYQQTVQCTDYSPLFNSAISPVACLIFPDHVPHALCVTRAKSGVGFNFFLFFVQYTRW